MDKLLAYFNVNSHEELKQYIEENPEDEKIKSFKEVLEMLDEEKEDEE